VSFDVQLRMTTSKVGPRTHARKDIGKRAADITLATILILLLSPILLLLALVVAMSSPGPVFFRQVRLGRAEQPFAMLKFRTMFADANDDIHREFVKSMFETTPPSPGEAGLHKLTDDPRVTAAGRVLRRMSLDELPQLLNVLAGDMSLVGPRPALPWEVELFEPQHLVRFDVKPGMTGLWQVSGRSALSMAQALDLDTEYVRRRGFRLDMSILLRTIPVVVTGRGAT
jgi:lipopolysaccharide/colanic/teichoic acid biosynthesis glycosyltransferase